MLDAAHLTELHDFATLHWHRPEATLPEATPPEATPPGPPTATALDQLIPDQLIPDQPILDRLILDQHRANFDLWHREDQARDPLASDHAIVHTKHEIDRLNQRRNDLVEQIDLALLKFLQPDNKPNPATPLHSETPGLIIDRLSILALKIFHTAEEVHRPSATPAHRDRNLARLSVLTEQRDDLAACLNDLWADVLAGRRRFKLYQQLKMYNDPSLNPVLYGKSSP
jgi:hypothetical protein